MCAVRVEYRYNGHRTYVTEIKSTDTARLISMQAEHEHNRSIEQAADTPPRTLSAFINCVTLTFQDFV